MPKKNTGKPSRKPKFLNPFSSPDEMRAQKARKKANRYSGPTQSKRNAVKSSIQKNKKASDRIHKTKTRQSKEAFSSKYHNPEDY